MVLKNKRKVVKAMALKKEFGLSFTRADGIAKEEGRKKKHFARL